MSLYRYRNIEIEVIGKDGRYADAIPVSDEAHRIFTLYNGVMKVPLVTLQLFKHDTKTT